MRPRIAALAFVFALACSMGRAFARTGECAGPVTPCINDDTLWPHAGPSFFAAVGSTETTGASQLGLGLVTSYLSRPVVLRVPAPGGDGSSQYAVNDQVNGTFLWSFGVTRRLELDLALPLTFGQGGTALQPITGGSTLHDTAIRDLRFGLAYVLVPHGPGDSAGNSRDASAGDARAASGVRGGMVARFEMSAPTGDHDQFASDGTAVFVPSVAADLRGGRWFAGAEVGARIRPIAELLGARIGTQLVAALGVGVDLVPRQLLSATLEAWALPTLAGQETQTGASGGALVPAEWQLSARTAPIHGGDVAIQLGGGSAIPFGSDPELTRPRLRFTLGVRWAPRSRDTKPGMTEPVTPFTSSPQGNP